MPLVLSEYTRPGGFYSSSRKVFNRGGHFNMTVLPAIPTKGSVCRYVLEYRFEIKHYAKIA